MTPNMQELIDRGYKPSAMTNKIFVLVDSSGRVISWQGVERLDVYPLPFFRAMLDQKEAAGRVEVIT